MDELSVFVDESGDFGFNNKSSKYYIISMVFHEQNNNIQPKINKIDKELLLLCNNDEHVVHTEPLISRRKKYYDLTLQQRRKILQKLYFFTIKCNIKYKQFYFLKKSIKDNFDLKLKIIKEITSFFKEYYKDFSSYSKLILYYDNGQKELSNILNSVLAAVFQRHETRLAYQKDYRLSQVADMLCTFRILEERAKTNTFTHSELLIFGSRRELLKNYIKPLKKLEWK